MSCLDSDGSVRTVFVDFRTAFDLVNHIILYNKLKKYGIPDFILLWFGSYLSNRQQRVRANQFISSWKELTQWSHAPGLMAWPTVILSAD